MRASRVLFVLLLAVVYLPLLIKGGFGTSDDLALLVGFKDGFSTEMMASVSRSGHISRPIYGLVQVLTLYFFGDDPIYYSIFRISLWLLSAFVLFKTFRPIIGERSASIFLLLFSFPIFTSAHLLNSFQTGYVLALLFWSLSLCVVARAVPNNNWRPIIASFALLMLSMLSCEILFPLFILNMLIPIYILKANNGVKMNANINVFSKRNALSIVFAIVIYVIYKFSVSVIYIGQGAPYGFAFSAHSILQALYYFVSIAAGIPMLLLEAGQHLSSSGWAWTALLVIPWIYILWKNEKDRQELRFSSRNMNIVLLISLVLCFLVFLLSGYPAVTYGNYNKMMLPAFVVVCLLLGILFSKVSSGKAFFVVIPVVFLWVFSMNLQVANFIRSWEIRNHVLTDLSMRLNDAPLGQDPVVVANVPYFTNADYNNEHVFWLEWDFLAGAKYFGLEKDVELFPFCHRTLVDSSVYPLHNVNGFIGDRDIENLWVYEVEEGDSLSTLERIVDLGSYKKQRMKAPINDHELIPRVHLRQKLKELIQAEDH